MKITVKFLEEHGACSEAIEEFMAHNLEDIEVWDLIKILEERKKGNGYIMWLFDECKLTGLCKGWYPDGQLWYEENCEDGELHGLCKGWYADGKKMYEHNFKNGKRHGLYRGWRSDGQLVYEENYIDGVLK